MSTVETTVCECGHTALTHHGVDGRVRRDAGCQTNTRRDDWCRCPLTCIEVMTERRPQHDYDTTPVRLGFA